jgi:molybdopterin converting factor small subunit
MNATIEIRLFATLSAYLPSDAGRYPIQPGTSVAMLAEQLGLPRDQVKLIFINGIRVDFDSVLKGGERVGMFPPVGGG